ncbi:hypothetical protein BDN71DRAFT_156327 [Pleurotus eryngii]|uniref:Uncharacterized protein n=1 Tax=Pleurotus eryngii TaxID=5323 RepID=A0A9P6DBI5_PLEER|nr:hypothetical protein BDN71DRAFT_156327 [Pleurotus eryngii]
MTSMRDCDYCTSCDEDKSARAGMGKKSMDWGVGSMGSADMNVMGVGMGTGRPYITTASAINATNPPFPPAPMSRTSPSTMHSMHMSPASTPSTTSSATRSATPQVESLSTSASGRRLHRVAEFPPSASPSHLSRTSLSSPPPHSTSRSSNAITFDEVRKRMRGPLFLPEPTLAELDFKSYSDAEGAIMISSAPALMSRPPLRNYGKDDSMKRKRKRKQGLLLRCLLHDDGEKEEKTEANNLGLGKKGAKREETGILEEGMSRCRRCRKEYLVEMNTPRAAHETPLQYSALFASPLSGAVVNAEDAGDMCKEDTRPEQTRRSGLWLSLVSKSCLQPSLTLASTSSTFLDLPSSPTLSSPSLASSSLSPTPTPSSPSPSSSSLSSDGASSSTSSNSSLISTATSSSSLITTPASSPCTSPEGKEYLRSGIVDEPLLNPNNNQTPQGASSRLSGFSFRSWLSPYVSGTESTSPLDHVDALNNFDTLPLPDLDEPELRDHHSLKEKLQSEEETCSCYRRRLRHPRSHLPFSSNATGGHRHRKLKRTVVTFGDCPLSTTRVDAPAFLSATAATNEQPKQTFSLAVPRIIPSLSLGRALSSHLATVGKVLQQFKQFHTAYVGAVAGFAVIAAGNENYGVAGVEERGGQSVDKVVDAGGWLMGSRGVGTGRGMGGVMYGVGVRRGVGGGGLMSPAGYGERVPEETAAKVRGRGRIRVRRKKSGYRAKKEDVANVFPPQAVAPPSSTTAAAMTLKEVAVSRAAAGFRSPVSGTYEELDDEGDDRRVVELAPLSRRTLSSSSGSSRGRRRLTSSTSFVASSSPYNPNSRHPPSSSSSPSPSRSSSSLSRIPSTSSSSKASYSPYAHSTDHIIASSGSTPTAAVKKATTPIYLRPIANPVYLRLKAVQNVVRVMTYVAGNASSNTVSSSADDATATAVDVVEATISSGLANPLLRDTSASASATPSTSSSNPTSLPPPDVDPTTITDRKVTIEDTVSALALGPLRAGAMGSGRERVCGIGGGGRRRSLLGMGSLCADAGVECC